LCSASYRSGDQRHLRSFPTRRSSDLHAVRCLDDLLGQQATLVEADVARRRADQARYRVRLHVLGHVEAHQLDPELQRKLAGDLRSEEHTSELQSRENLVCRLLLEKKK